MQTGGKLRTANGGFAAEAGLHECSMRATIPAHQLRLSLNIVTPTTIQAPPVLLVGQPNVGKSALFGVLTGLHAHVSNYPGTTVSVSRGTWELAPGRTLELVDTPGAYSLLPVTDEEQVTRDALFREPVAAVLHMVEANNLDRSLATTLELQVAGLPVVLVLNMWDEAKRTGVQVDTAALSERLGCPVVPMVAVRSEGIEQLQAAVEEVMAAAAPSDVGQFWVEEFGPVVDEVASKLDGRNSLPRSMPPRIAAVLALRGSTDITEACGLESSFIAQSRQRVAQRVAGMPPVAAILALRQRANEVLDGLFVRPQSPSQTLRHRFGMVLAHPLWGLPFLAVVLYFGFYQLVGVYAAGDLVGLLEETVFGAWVMPGVTEGVESVLPWPIVSSLLVGQYGILTLGITYAFALVLPVVGAFFIVFSLVEDSGYFPRLALLCDRLFKRVGLNGRAVITMILGLGCSTMATVTTRTLEQPRDRIIATLLLVLTIPCSAQLGLIIALLGSRGGFTLWITYVGCLLALFFLVGFVAAKVLPGRNATFHMEIIPMRMPRMGNVMRKTWHRLYWYFREVVPLFVYASIVLWVLDMRSSTLFGFVDTAQAEAANMLHWIKSGMEPFMVLLDQPREAAESFLIGFFRRDFGAAGLFKLNEAGSAANAELLLTDRQMLVGSFTLTLFVPCIATFMMMWNERGSKVALTTFGLVTLIAVASGALLNQILLALSWQ